MSTNLLDYLSGGKSFVESKLDELLPSEATEPAILHQAMRYAIFAGGKRIRPILAIAAGEAVGGSAEQLVYLCAAIECVHTYSLIHDDLPSMDDDDLRRGKPTTHKMFGEAVAILAGDALLTFAFELLAGPASMRVSRNDKLLISISDLAQAAGSKRLVCGQTLDIINEGQDVTPDLVDRIVKFKTGALIKSSLTCGARLAGALNNDIAKLGAYGERIGAAFQIRDDLLDLEGDANALGKKVNKDFKRGKATFPKLYGKEKSNEMIKQMLESAIQEVEPFGVKAEPLILIADYVGRRLN